MKKLFLFLLGFISLWLYAVQSYGIVLTSCQYVDAAGYYELGNSISNQDGDCFLINGSDIIFDCKGYVIGGDGDTIGYGIHIDASGYGALDNITIKNCTVHSFKVGIYAEGSSSNGVTNITILDANISYNSDRGISLYYSYDAYLANILTLHDGLSGVSYAFCNGVESYNITSKYNEKGAELSPTGFNSRNIILKDSIIQDNNLYDLYYDPLDATYCTGNIMQNITGTGNLPILYYNTSVNLADMHVAELILCNASSSQFTNLTVGGFGNNGIYVYFSDNVSFYRVNSSYNHDGIYMEGGSLLNITDFYTRNSVYHLIAIISCNDVLIKDGYIIESGEDGIRVESSSDILIDNVSVSGTSGWYDAYFDSSSGINIMNSSFTTSNQYGIYLTGSSLISLKDIIVRNHADIDLYYDPTAISDCTGNIMQNITGTGNLPILYYNTSVNLADMHVAELILCNASSSQFTNLTVGGFGNNGIYVYFSDNVSFYRVNSSYNYDGIIFDNSDYCNVMDGDFINDEYNTVLLNYVDYCLIEGSYFKHENGAAINLQYSNYNIIKNNYIMVESFYKNTFSFWYSSYNEIYNNIINNSYNYVSSYFSSNNDFNVTPSAGPNIINRPFIAGNVWAKPDGTGFSETCTDANHDGICDSSYDTGYGIDYAPLAFSATYPLNPKLYLDGNLVWSYSGLFDGAETVDITSYVLNYLASSCSSFPCSVPITVSADSRGIIKIGNIQFKVRDPSNLTYIIKVENNFMRNAYIKNITIIDKTMEHQCSTNLLDPLELLTSSIKTFKIPCPGISCSSLGDVIVETTCGIKAKLSDIWEVNLHRVLKC